jgi:hypothetical protein
MFAQSVKQNDYGCGGRRRGISVLDGIDTAIIRFQVVVAVIHNLFHRRGRLKIDLQGVCGFLSTFKLLARIYRILLSSMQCKRNIRIGLNTRGLD